MIQDKIEDMKRAGVALRNTSLVNMSMLKYNAGKALELAEEVIQELADDVAKQKKAVQFMAKKIEELEKWQNK